MTDKNCIFCRIAAGEIPSAKVYEDDRMLVFKDIEPKAKVHLLAIAKAHFPSLHEEGDENALTVAYMLTKIPAIARANGCESGYRLVVNQGVDAGQTVFHLHFHILGGETLPW